MLLTGKEIEKRIGDDIIIQSFDKKRLNPNSYNLRLREELKIYSEKIIDMKKDNQYDKITIPNDGMVLYPNNLYLGSTKEYTETYNLVPKIDGRSSIGRLGISIHATAGVGDIGFKGYWTLEISCIQPVKIYPGVEFCQIYYETVTGKIENYNSDKYQNNNGTQTSKLYKEFL